MDALIREKAKSAGMSITDYIVLCAINKKVINYDGLKELTAAEKAHPCVAVTEPNWSAMIYTQRAQIELLKEIRETLPTLTTGEELKMYMDEQLKVLIQYTEQSQTATEQFQTAMEASAAELTEGIKKLITDTDKQVGRMSESFSSNLSMLRSTAEDKLERHTNKLFWISLIPSAVLIALELVRHILLAASVI